MNGLFIVLGLVAVGMGTFTLKSQQVVIGDQDALDERVAHLHGLLRIIAGLVTLAGVLLDSLALISLGTLGIMFGGGVTLIVQALVNQFFPRESSE
ncbi:MAG: hypothetical protein JXA10_05310 [Anaerolineae bacterium]|nr:hypothetical protein [Anaerolineae bacterium]